jgi:hypothetical protein
MKDVDKIQYEQALSTLREQYNMLIAILSLLFTADLALVGFAAEAKSAVMLLVACIIPLSMFAATVEMRRHMHPFIYFCAYLEHRHELQPGIMTTYIGSAFDKYASNVLRQHLREIATGSLTVEHVDHARQATTRHFLLKFCLPYYGTLFACQVALAIFGFVVWA